ncbi:MAG TPA: SAM-dependent methyltransferase [Pyrinomonadaceae bacterium]|nr:SAM-dependent methyltransferase [Pyrinomonadaceae bacterium]
MRPPLTPREEDDDSTHLSDSLSDTLAARLRARINAEGPISFRDWMEAALYDERAGYYRRARAARWGRAGDYRTSPERTPLFAATFARYFATLHEQLGAPSEFNVVEAGAGAGDFAAVLLATLRRDHPRVYASLRYLIDEKGIEAAGDVRADEMADGETRADEFENHEFENDARGREVEGARARLAAKLAPFEGCVASFSLARARESFEACVVFSNELIDALPVHRVRRVGGALVEMFVGLDDAGAFAWVEREPSTPRLAEHFRSVGVALEEGQAAEVNLDAEEWVASAARVVGRGYVVTIDYGDEASRLYDASARREGTLRAFKRHAFAANVLDAPGQQDITTTVDWTQVRAAGERAGLRTLALEPLPRFLARAGLLEQLERETELAQDEAERTALRLGAREMILPGGMAGSFQVLVQEKV